MTANERENTSDPAAASEPGRAYARSAVPSDAFDPDAEIRTDRVGEDNYYERDAPYSEWLKWYREIDYPRYRHPDVTVDCVILTVDESMLHARDRSLASQCLKVLAVDRWTHPFRGMVALPGTFMRPDDQDAQDVIIRMLREHFDFDALPKGEYNSTDNYPFGSEDLHIRQLQTFTGSHRDPRGQVVSIAHLVYMPGGVDRIPESDGVRWEPLLDFAERELAFDHHEIVAAAISRLRSQFAWLPQIFWSLPSPFTVTDALKVRASLFDEDYKAINRKNFKRKYQAVWVPDHVEINPVTKMPVDFYRYDGAVFQ
jgi:ADP-ribose pyrophosphatase